MNESSMLRMKWFVDNYVSKLSKDEITILDVGSYDVNGSYKILFSEESKYQYIGLDIEDGPNVDIVLKSPYNWDEITTDSFDVIISGQAFEHIEFFWITMIEMVRILKKNGLLCIIVPRGTAEHRYPVDCYRFFADGMIALARYTNLEILHVHTNCAPPDIDKPDVWYNRKYAESMLVARKNYNGSPDFTFLKTYKCVPGNHKLFRGNMLPSKSRYVPI